MGQPVLFAEMKDNPVDDLVASWANTGGVWAPENISDCAIIVDLPGADAVVAGYFWATIGFRPVPLFNGCPGAGAAVDVQPILHALLNMTSYLKALPLKPDAPPVFLLDSSRMRNRVPITPGVFDNRWLAFPEDFPSATFLLSHNIKNAILIHELPAHASLHSAFLVNDTPQPQEDLAHVLLRWQQAGILIQSKDVHSDAPPKRISVAKPGMFKTLYRRAMVLLGLHRNDAGGFGSEVPQPGSGG